MWWRQKGLSAGGGGGGVGGGANQGEHSSEIVKMLFKHVYIIL